MRKLLLITLLLACFASIAQAQDNSHTITLETPVSGVIDAQHLIQMYRFQADSSGSGTFGITNTGAIPLAAVMIDLQGEQVAQTGAAAPGASESTNWTGSGSGTFYLIVFPPQGVSGGQGSFTLSLGGAVPASTSAAGFNLQFVLTWQKQARLSLEVRDPQGESLHWRSLKTDDGGEFTGDIEPAACSTPPVTPNTRTQTARWQTDESGSYELLVHYIDGCDQSVPFTVAVRLNDQNYPLISGTSQPDQTYVGGFSVDPNHSGVINAVSGMVSDTPMLTIPTADLVAAAQPLASGAMQSGTIDSSHPYRTYVFDGKIGAQISMTAQHISGNLDTLIALIDGSGNLIALNDDANDTVTDSALDNVRLPRSERYYVIVTRYAELLGSTEGTFLLTVIGLSS